MMIAGGVIGGLKPASIFFTHDDLDVDIDDQFMFTVSIGSQAPGRKIIFVVGQVPFVSDFSRVAFNGAPVSPIIDATTMHLFIVDAPEGETANIECSFVRDVSGCGVMVWAAYGLKSSVPVDSTGPVTIPAGQAGVDLSVNTKTGGLVVGATWDGANGTSQTWTGLTRNFQNTSSIDNYCRSAASAIVDRGASPREITVTSSNTTSARRAFAASFR